MNDTLVTCVCVLWCSVQWEGGRDGREGGTGGREGVSVTVIS